MPTRMGTVYAGETYVVYGGANAPGTDGVLDLSERWTGPTASPSAALTRDDRSGIFRLVGGGCQW